MTIYSLNILLSWFGTSLLFYRRRKWEPIPVLLPGKSHGQRSLVGYSPWGLEELDTTEQLHFHFSLSCIGEGNGNPLPVFLPGESRDRGAKWAAIYGVAQSRTRLKWLSSSSSCCSMYCSNCCFLTCIQIFQEASKMDWYSHLLKNFPQFVVIHTVKGFSVVSEGEEMFFLNVLAFLWSDRCWEFDLWFLCLF